MGSNRVARQDLGSVLESVVKASARWTAAWMRQGVVALSIGAVLLGAAWPALADEAALTRNANLRRDPSTARPPIRRLAPPDEVEIIDATPTNGYYHVRDEDQEEGWVWGGSIRILSDTPGSTPSPAPSPISPSTAGAVSSTISSQWQKPAPNQTHFDGADGMCGPTGDGGDTATNLRKNRTDIPSAYHDVTWDAVAKLPYPVAPKSRANWTPAQLAQIAPYEGVALRVVGYLVAIKPQAGGNGESTNCHFTNESEVDWHIAFVGQAGEGEKASVVIETTPRVRQSHPRWTPQALHPWLNTDTPVRISGWLMLDPEHRNHLGKYRSTLWEIHPITKIEVFKDNRWVDLDTLP